jgi:hypothetical protein
MGNNYLYQFAADVAALTLTDSEYELDSQRPIGNQPGIARADFVNKSLKQSSFIAAVVAQFIVDYSSEDVQDDQLVSLAVTNLFSAIHSGVQGSKRVNKTQLDSPYDILISDLGGMTVFTNVGATGEVILNLPAGADGQGFKAIVMSEKYMRFVANGSEIFRYKGGYTAVGGYVRSNVIGNTIEMVWAGTQWVIVGLTGPWDYDK